MFSFIDQYGGNTPCPLHGEQGNIERKWYVIDAAGKPMGKTAVAAAGSAPRQAQSHHTPHADCGDNVIIINASKRHLAGNKMEQKYYRMHWLGRRSEGDQDHPRQEKPTSLRWHVRGMMPRNTVTKDLLKRLHIYAGDTHEQQPAGPVSSCTRKRRMYQSKKPYLYGTARKSSVARVLAFSSRAAPALITSPGRDIDEYFGLET